MPAAPHMRFATPSRTRWLAWMASTVTTHRSIPPRVSEEPVYGLEYRAPPQRLRLPYSNAETYTPDNVTLIGGWS